MVGGGAVVAPEQLNSEARRPWWRSHGQPAHCRQAGEQCCRGGRSARRRLAGRVGWAKGVVYGCVARDLLLFFSQDQAKTARRMGVRRASKGESGSSSKPSTHWSSNVMIHQEKHV